MWKGRGGDAEKSNYTKREEIEKIEGRKHEWQKSKKCLISCAVGKDLVSIKCDLEGIKGPPLPLAMAPKDSPSDSGHGGQIFGSGRAAKAPSANGPSRPARSNILGPMFNG